MSLISHSTAAAASSLVAQMQLQLPHWLLNCSCSCQFRFRPVERTWERLMSLDLNYHEKLRGEIVTWPQFIEQWIRVIMRLQQQRRQKPRWPAERMEKYFTFLTFSAFYLDRNISKTCASGRQASILLAGTSAGQWPVVLWYIATNIVHIYHFFAVCLDNYQAINLIFPPALDNKPRYLWTIWTIFVS